MKTVIALRLSSGQQVSLTHEIRVGTHPSCELLLAHPKVAPLHATFWVQDDFLFVRDENSDAGTIVNQYRIPAGQAFQLRVGDTVRLGGESVSVIQVTVHEIASPPPTVDVTARGAPVPAPPSPIGYMLRLPDGQEFGITRETRIGRNPTSHIRPDDSRVSGHHATLWIHQDILLVRDDGSTNGTYLNEVRLAPNQPTPLRFGDRLRIGQTTLTVAPASERPAGPPVQPPATHTVIGQTVTIGPPPAPPRPQVVILRGPDGQEHAITGETLVGREDGCQLVLIDPRASRRHALMWVQYGSLMVQDNDSTNGTFVNDVRLKPGQAAALRPGDRVRFADSVFEALSPGRPASGPLSALAGAPNAAGPVAAPPAAPMTASAPVPALSLRPPAGTQAALPASLPTTSPLSVAPASSARAEPVKPPPAGSRRRLAIAAGLLGALVVIALVVAVAVLAFLPLPGITIVVGGQATSAATTGASEMTLAEALAVEPLDARPETLRLMGPPDTFRLTFQELDGVTVRLEEWSYYDYASRFDFVDGELLWTIDIEPLPDGSLYAHFYDPIDFVADESSAEVRRRLEGVSLTEERLEELGIAGGAVLAGPQIVLGFEADRLVYVETFALSPEAAQ
jgi:pSer/pThr/pTyr-binding forkhead associated (FHA) protein